MAVLLKAGETVAFSPADQDGRSDGERIVYHLTVPSTYDRIRYRRELAAAGARYHPALEMLGLLRRGAETLMAESDAAAREFVIAAIEEQAERVRTWANEARDLDLGTDEGRTAFAAGWAAVGDGEAALAQIEALVREGYPAYAQAAADNAVYWDLAGLVAARLFLAGVDGLPGFRRGATGTDEAFLAAIPPAHLTAIGLRFQDLLSPTEAEAKNSGSPSPSGSNPQPTTTASPRAAAAGKSSVTSTPKTRRSG